MITSPRSIKTDTDIEELINRSGASTAVGYVYTVDPDNDNSFIYNAGSVNTLKVFVAPSIILNNSAKAMIINGVADVYVDGSVDRGDYLHFSTINGQALGEAGPCTENCFGYVLESRVGEGLVKSMIQPIPASPSAGDDAAGNVGTFLLPVAGALNQGWVRAPGNPIIRNTMGGNYAFSISEPAAPVYRNGYLYVALACRPSSAVYAEVSIAKCHVIDDDIDLILTPGNWEEGEILFALSGVHAQYPCLIYDVTIGKYRIWFGRADYLNLYYSECDEDDDPTLTANWSTKSSQTKPASFQIPYGVVLLGSRYMLLYGDGSDLYSAYSYDGGITDAWKNGTIIVARGSAGAWDDYFIRYASIFVNSGIVYVLYTGISLSTMLLDFGLAYGTIPEFLSQQTLAKDPVNPYFSTIGGWEGAYLFRPSLFAHGRNIYQFYSNKFLTTVSPNQVGVAYIDLEE